MEYDQMMQTIRREVDTKHLSYGDLAKKLGVTRQCIYNYLNGKRGNEIKAEKGSKVMRTDTLLRLCDVLGLQVTITSKKAASGGKIDIPNKCKKNN